MPDDPSKRGKPFPKAVDAAERRKLRARGKKQAPIWFGLGMFGVVGWAVAVPTVLGIFLGVWIDLHWPGPYSWTLMLLVVGLALGCLNAGFWVRREKRTIDRDREES